MKTGNKLIEKLLYKEYRRVVTLIFKEEEQLRLKMQILLN